MKAKYIGDNYKVRLIKNKIYKVTSDSESGWYYLVDETGDDGFFPPEEFEIVEK